MMIGNVCLFGPVCKNRCVPASGVEKLGAGREIAAAQRLQQMKSALGVNDGEMRFIAAITNNTAALEY